MTERELFGAHTMYRPHETHACLVAVGIESSNYFARVTLMKFWRYLVVDPSLLSDDLPLILAYKPQSDPSPQCTR